MTAYNIKKQMEREFSEDQRLNETKETTLSLSTTPKNDRCLELNPKRRTIQVSLRNKRTAK